MYALKVLHKKLKQACPFIHQKRLTILVFATQALLVGQRLSLTQLGRRLSSTTQVKHNIKRIDRLLGNTHLHRERSEVYRFLVLELLKGNKRPLIIVDWSELTTERNHQLLRASVPVGGRALTLYEEVHSRKHYGAQKVHKRFLKKLKQLLPNDCCPIVVTDAGFRNTWFKVIISLNWDYVGRIRNNDLVQEIGKKNWYHCKCLYTNANHRPQYLGQYVCTRGNPLQTAFYIVKHKPKGRHKRNIDGSRTSRAQSEKCAQRQKEPWLLTTSLDEDQAISQEVIAIYKSRMQIEEAFRDTKNHRIGFSLSESQTRHPHRLEVLLLIGALATFLTWLTGLFAELKQWHWQYQSNSNRKRRVLSLFFIGCQIMKENRFRLKPKEYETALLCLRHNALAQAHL